MANNWIQHVKQTQQKHNCSYKEALQLAKQTYKTGGSLKDVERQFKNFGRKAKRDLEKINPFNNKKFNRVGQKLGDVTHNEITPFVQTVGSEIYDKTLMALDPLTGGLATPLGKLLYDKMGRPYMRNAKSPITRNLALMTKAGVKYSSI